MRLSPKQALYALLCAFLIVILAGCGSTAANVKAEVYCYKTVDTTARLVHVGMSAAGEAYRKGLLPEKGKETLAKAHQTYQPIANTALSGCDAVGSKGDADKIIEKLKAVADDVIRALVATGVMP